MFGIFASRANIPLSQTGQGFGGQELRSASPGILSNIGNLAGRRAWAHKRSYWEICAGKIQPGFRNANCDSTWVFLVHLGCQNILRNFCLLRKDPGPRGKGDRFVGWLSKLGWLCEDVQWALLIYGVLDLWFQPTRNEKYYEKASCAGLACNAGIRVWAQVRLPAVRLSVQFPAEQPRKRADDVLNSWTPNIHMVGLDGVPEFGFLFKLNKSDHFLKSNAFTVY